MLQPKRRQLSQTLIYIMMLLFLLLLIVLNCTQAEIAQQSQHSNRLSEPGLPRCALRYRNMVRTIEDVEDLYLDVPVHIALEQRKKKRFLLQLNQSTPLTIRFSAPVARKLYYNQTANILRPLMATTEPTTTAAAAAGSATSGHSLILPCALRGQYDLFVLARQRGELEIEAYAGHPQQSWPLLNRTVRINIRAQKVRKRQLKVKWDRSNVDHHALNYCLVINSQRGASIFPNFCEAVYAYAVQQKQLSGKGAICGHSSGMGLLELIFSRQQGHARRLDTRHSLHIICTGSRTQQVLRGLQPNSSYQLQLFGVHKNRQNLTFSLAHSLVHFNRTHPIALRQQTLAQLKIGGQHSAQVYSFKVPPAAPFIRYLLVPCSGSEIKVQLLRQRQAVADIKGIYAPMYIKQTGVAEGERYLIRFQPGNEDEALRAQKVRLAVSSEGLFKDLAEMPENITVFNLRTRCTTTSIAWHSSPDERPVSYCIIIFNLPQRNRSSAEHTNYCMDFEAQRVAKDSHFVFMRCRDQAHSASSELLETETIIGLKEGASYLVYVTVALSGGKQLPYETLTLHMGRQCATNWDSVSESHEQLYY